MAVCREIEARDRLIKQLAFQAIVAQQENAQLVQVIRELSVEIVGLRNQLRIREEA